jgi:hypothetical protein
MALVEVCSFLLFFVSLGVLFPIIELFILMLSPQIEWMALDSVINHDDCDTPPQYEENSFADGILWADVGNDL